MKLSIAINNLVSLQGASILSNANLINYLSDFQGFEDMPSAKFVMKTMFSEGYLQKIKSSYENGFTSLYNARDIYSDLRNVYAFREEVISFIINQIEEGLNWNITEFEVPKQKNISSVAEGPSSTTGNHCQFKGIPICGSVNTIESKLNAQGYVTLEKSPEDVLLSGSFAGIDNCNILVTGSPYINNEVYSIAVIFPERQNWFSLKGDYDRYKEKLSSKYGAPFENTEFFLDPYYEGDGYELSALANEKAFFITKFNIDNGYIRIMIGGSRLYISYTDREGENRMEVQRESVAQDEL